ncbi:hypothetical protein AB6A40_001661 [Gnathostoma spinigerum]|uniref:Methylcrotonoyl-CoA carboxylase subunit alpha, mitochondrial n=1 Tax=Gnathostoma spinigerum TaxID=75299 RepID=A0ABD6E6S9_9BILA
MGLPKKYFLNRLSLIGRMSPFMRNIIYCSYGNGKYNFSSVSNGALIGKISRLLIANRGEIALRVMRTARRLGIETVSVYSDADRRAMHVKQADKAFHIGAASSLDSYLNMDKVISIALRCGAQAIHPGYGFLSENAEFAEKCTENGIIFIGPSPQAIRDMGAKNVSKQLMAGANVPVILGYHGSCQTNEKLATEADRIGYPVMLKAVFGGGGKGMRIVRNKKEFEEKLSSARSEANKAFGNCDILVEKFVERPRHVEVQIFGDHHGNYVHLWERDCSIQRRHQKIIEEAPAPHLSPETRQEIGESAVRAAKAVNYVGAGTVEFIMDTERRFYFMEMNTRLQVEHPVTEAITGTDLVEWQIRVAEGEKLPMRQEDIFSKGHAIEARIYAEDTKNDFLPTAGKLNYLRFPANARIDSGVQEGDEVSIHYDPMIAKVIILGKNREDAIARLCGALQKTRISGLSTNISFVRSVLQHPEFIKGNVSTDFINDFQNELVTETPLSRTNECEAITALLLFAQCITNPPFQANDYFRLNLPSRKKIELFDKHYEITIESASEFLVKFDDIDTKVRVCDILRKNNVISYSMEEGGETSTVDAVLHDDKVTVFGKDTTMEFSISSADSCDADSVISNNLDVVAPMPGIVEKVFVKVGDKVVRGQPLVILVAMKMEYTIRSPCDAVIQSILCSLKRSVAKDSHLVKLE